MIVYEVKKPSVQETEGFSLFTIMSEGGVMINICM